MSDSFFPEELIKAYLEMYNEDEETMTSYYIDRGDTKKEVIEDSIISGIFGDALANLFEEHPGWVDVDQIIYDLQCEGSIDWFLIDDQYWGFGTH